MVLLKRDESVQKQLLLTLKTFLKVVYLIKSTNKLKVHRAACFKQDSPYNDRRQ